MPAYEIYRDAFAITASDSLPLKTRVDAIYVGGAGAVALETEGGDNVTFAAVPVGTTLKFSTDKVLSTGTTATNLLGLVYNVLVGTSTGTGGGAIIDPYIFDDSGAALLADDGTQLTL